jgi:hypothetical protein
MMFQKKKKKLNITVTKKQLPQLIPRLHSYLKFGLSLVLSHIQLLTKKLDLSHFNSKTYDDGD